MFRILLFLLAAASLVFTEPVTLRVMLIGWPLYDTKDAITGQPVRSVYNLFREFEAENPDIKIAFIPAQWGSSSAGYLPKTRALLLSDALDVLEVTFTTEFANQGTIANLEPWINRDLDTTQYLPGGLDRYAALIWKDGLNHRYCLPLYFGVRMTGYDRQIFRDFGMDTLAPVPTPSEVLEKAARMTGTNPRTGKKTYGLFFQGQYKIFLITNLMEAFGGSWGHANPDASLHFNWNTPQNENAIVWLLKASQYGPPSMLGTGEEVSSVWGTQDNFVAIRLHAYGNDLYNQNYVPGIREQDNTQRFRYVQLFRDTKGEGGFAFGSGIAMASGTPHPEEAWRFIRWMSAGRAAQEYIARDMKVYPVIRPAYHLPVFGENENFRNAMAEMDVPTRNFPYGNTPMRYTMENELDKAFQAARECGFDTLRLKELARAYLENLQRESEAWVASEKRYGPDRYHPFVLRRFALPFFAGLGLFILALLVLGRKAVRRNLSWYLFLLPSLAAMVVFLAYPIAESLRLSLFRSNGFTEAFAGLDNFKFVAADPNFLNALYNTAYIALFNLALGIPIGFILASLINSQKKAQAAFKMLYFMPMVTSVIASAVLFKYLFAPDIGLVNFVLRHFGLPADNLLWLASPATSKFVVILFALWHGTGYTVLICLSGLQSVPDQLYEAASIDGCSGFQKWRHITLPNMRPTFVFLFMTGCIGALKRFEDVFTFGGMLGMPARSMQTVVAYIFEQAFGAFNFGAASAAAYLLFALILAITVVNYRAMLHKEA